MLPKRHMILGLFFLLSHIFFYVNTVEAQVNTTTTVASSLNPSTYQASVTFTASVSPTTATGTVTFKDGATILSTVTFYGGNASIYNLR
jgi:hypothetical protein